VLSVSIYAWSLPEDLTPLKEAIGSIAAGETDVVTFTSAQQVRNVLRVAADMGQEGGLRRGLRTTLIGSIGPTTSQVLYDAGLGVDYEPDRVKMGDLVRGLARSARMLLERKRASAAAGVDTSRMRRVDVFWPVSEAPRHGDPLRDSPFMKACRREPTPYTPIWIMRQAGRYQREYRDMRARHSFLEMCMQPELAAEVTLMAVDRLGVDAAIIFSDILLLAQPWGLELSFHEGRGPVIGRPVRTARDVEALSGNPADGLQCVYDAIEMTRKALRPDVPLIGFCGAPFTVASYLVEGGSSRNFVQAKSLMYRDPGVWHALLDRIATVSADYLNRQIDAGAQVVQLFDSWVGCLDEQDYRAFVLPHTRKLISAVKPGVPVIHFGANTGLMLPAIREAGGDVIGLDWRVDLREAWATLGHDVAVQGNLDPVVLFATPGEIEKRAREICARAEGRPGHIFNLGHGVLPDTPFDHVLALIDAVQAYRPEDS
jgi:uroporphyrinogen decarboxylase